MNRLKLLSLVILAALCLTGCSSDDDTTDSAALQQPTTVTLNVDVVLPRDIQQQWQPAISMALKNLQLAQRKQQRQVLLNLRYHDEDTEDLDKLALRLTKPQEGDDTCHAIIGPYHSTNAPTILMYAAQKRLPVVMPTCSSSELQRTNARNTYAWFLTESDVTQCEIMISAAKAMSTTDVALVYSDDKYGESFEDWFGFYATEQRLNVPGLGKTTYRRGDNLKTFLDDVTRQAIGDQLTVFVALSDAADYEDVCRQVNDYDASGKDIVVNTIGTDTSYSDEIVNSVKASAFTYGITPVGSMAFGFPQAFYAETGRRPYTGEAQVYDALCIIAMGAAHMAANPDSCLVFDEQVAYKEPPYDPGLTDHMRSIVSQEGTESSWTDAGLASAFSRINSGEEVCIIGATGPLNFDAATATKSLNTTYMVWQLNQVATVGDEVSSYAQPIIYLSTGAQSGTASNKVVWEEENRLFQEFDINDDIEDNLPAVSDRWAVVVSPSTYWYNYRHQADAFAMYQLLRQSGYADDHIVLIVQDNLADDTRNKLPGQIFVERDASESNNSTLNNLDVRKGAVVDYHFKDLQPDDLADIMLGRQSARLPHVIHPTATSDVFFFWSGHGGPREGPLWGDEDAQQYFGTKRLSDMVDEMQAKQQFRRLFFAIETCYSGKWGEALKGKDNVMVLTAANSHEESHADMHDRTLGVYLSNAFSRSFRHSIEANNRVTIYDLYRNLARTTTSSHVTIYNQQHYGSVYKNTMEEYFPHFMAN